MLSHSYSSWSRNCLGRWCLTVTNHFCWQFMRSRRLVKLRKTMIDQVNQMTTGIDQSELMELEKLVDSALTKHAPKAAKRTRTTKTKQNKTTSTRKSKTKLKISCMRIGIDCRLAGLQHAGIGRYTAQLVLHLIRSRSNVEWVLFCQSREQADEFIGKSPVANVRVVLAKVSHYSIAEQLYLPWIFYREQLDLLHVPHFNVPLLYLKPFVVTIPTYSGIITGVRWQPSSHGSIGGNTWVTVL